MVEEENTGDKGQREGEKLVKKADNLLDINGKRLVHMVVLLTC